MEKLLRTWDTISDGNSTRITVTRKKASIGGMRNGRIMQQTKYVRLPADDVISAFLKDVSTGRIKQVKKDVIAVTAGGIKAAVYRIVGR